MMSELEHARRQRDLLAKYIARPQKLSSVDSFKARDLACSILGYDTDEHIKTNGDCPARYPTFEEWERGTKEAMAAYLRGERL